MPEEIERVNYYQLQYLGAEDFKAEQAYHRDMRRRHNVAHHLLGIVTGLELKEIAKGSGTGYDVYVQPGFAIDGFGREIIVTTPYKLDAADFRSVRTGTRAHEVWIAYREQLDTPPASGYATCGDEDQNKRVREEFRIVIDPAPPRHPPVVVGGKTAVVKSDPAAATAAVVIPDDESIPYQDFPADRERWLVRLGSATWDADKALFVPTSDAERTEGRVYTGVVAENVFSPSAKLLFRPRDFTAGSEDTADFVQVQGRLQVDGRIVAKKDVLLHGGRLSLELDGGGDGGVPFTLQRKAPAPPIGYDLRVDIGPKDGEQRLSIGTDSNDAATAKTILAVRAKNHVDIPTGKLNFGTDPLRQMVNLRTEEYGVGVQKGTLYNRTASAYAWYRGGVHDDTPAPAGPGGTMLMELTAANKLKVYGPIEGTVVRAPVLEANDVHVDGGKVQLRLPGGDPDTDEISLSRFRHSADHNDLRVVIGDNNLGDDAFTVGPIVSNSYVTQFRVRNNGETFVGGDLTLSAGRFVRIGAVRLGGNFPVDVIVGRYFVGIFDAVGSFPPLPQGPIQVVSRMPTVSAADVHLALSDVWSSGLGGAAYVYPTDKAIGGNVVSFRIGYTLSDTYVGWVTAVIVMTP